MAREPCVKPEAREWTQDTPLNKVPDPRDVVRELRDELAQELTSIKEAEPQQALEHAIEVLTQ